VNSLARPSKDLSNLAFSKAVDHPFGPFSDSFSETAQIGPFK
jgi:hypothetical protein